MHTRALRFALLESHCISPNKVTVLSLIQIKQQKQFVSKQNLNCPENCDVRIFRASAVRQRARERALGSYVGASQNCYTSGARDRSLSIELLHPRSGGRTQANGRAAMSTRRHSEIVAIARFAHFQRSSGAIELRSETPKRNCLRLRQFARTAPPPRHECQQGDKTNQINVFCSYLCEFAQTVCFNFDFDEQQNCRTICSPEDESNTTVTSTNSAHIFSQAGINKTRRKRIQ